MNSKKLLSIIEKHSLTVRCLPHVVVSHWTYKEGQEIKKNQEVVTLPKWNNRKFVRDEWVVTKGGWWYVKETANTNSTVRFSRKYDRFFAPTLEEAIQLYLDSKN